MFPSFVTIFAWRMGWVDLSDLSDPETSHPHGIVMVGHGGVEDPLKSGEPKVRKPQKPLFVRSWLWLYVNFESSTQKKLSQLGSSSEAVWKGKVFEIITQLFRSEPLCSWIFCGFAVHWATIFVSHNSMVSSAKNGGAATCMFCLVGRSPGSTQEYRNISCLSIFGMNDLGGLKIGYPPIQEFLLISPIKLPFWSILGYPPL